METLLRSCISPKPMPYLAQFIVMIEAPPQMSLSRRNEWPAYQFIRVISLLSVLTVQGEKKGFSIPFITQNALTHRKEKNQKISSFTAALHLKVIARKLHEVSHKSLLN